ncbi:MAG TPA: acetyl-CoA carboxylase biotin carboxyl carrier protein [Caulobacteraceae bacterium]|jgi:acetyl-CoA carboxylase biotin carboxyl carrier protein
MPSAKPPSDHATALVRELADILNETGLSEIEVERDGLKVRVARTLGPSLVQAYAPAQVAAPPLAAASPMDESEPVRTGDTVTSPMVGTVYLQPQPGSPPFVKVGDTVSAGQTLMLIEAMKTMNPIPATRAGVVLELLVGDSQPVEFGEPLAVIG